jgi:peptidoglycan hydrolase-like protein with peptidoglycan-binding domain
VTEQPELHHGHDGEWVDYLREMLRYHGYHDVEPTGGFDEPLTDAVRIFQESHGIEADGVVREDTWARLTTDVKGDDDTQSGTPAEIDPGEFPEIAEMLAYLAGGQLDDYLELIGARSE